MLGMYRKITVFYIPHFFFDKYSFIIRSFIKTPRYEFFIQYYNEIYLGLFWIHKNYSKYLF